MEHKQALKLFHTVCHNHGITNDEKQVIYSSYDVCSSKDMASFDLQKAAHNISSDAQLWRMRVLGSIGGYLNRNKIEGNLTMIKAIACRAAKADDFNRIPVRELRKLYNLFLKKAKSEEENRQNAIGKKPAPIAIGASSQQPVASSQKPEANNDNNDNNINYDNN